MGILRGFAVCLVTGCFAAQGAAAQSLRDTQIGAHTDTRMTAAFTLPLGAKRGSAEAKPRLDFTVATQAIGRSNSVTPLRFDPDYERQTMRTMRVSLTMEHNPRLAFNGQQIATFGPHLTANEDDKSSGLGTGGWILLGTAAAIGAGFLISEIVKDDIEDAIRGD